MKYTLLSAVLLLINGISYSQNPAWTDPVKRAADYPEKLYLTGFSSETTRKSVNPDELRLKHINYAKTELVGAIRTQISSSATLNLENMNSKSMELFRQASVSSSEAQLFGLKTESWYDAKKKAVYAFAYLRITDLVKGCTADVAEKTNQLKRKLETGDSWAQKGEVEQALKTYYDCFPIIREIENNQAILVAIGKEPMSGQSEDFEMEVNQRLNDLRKEKLSTLDDLCLMMADGIKKQLPEKSLDGTIRMGSFTYQDTRTGSEFAVRLANAFEQQMIRQGIPVKSPEVVYRGLSEPDTGGYLLTGTYWKEGNNLKVIANLKQNNNGRNIASVQEFLPEKWCADNGLRYVADNYDQVLVQQKQFAENEIINGGLFVDLWTNRGKDNPVFTRNDTMRVYVKVDQPCYMRLIYYLSDGRKTLLADSRYIPETETGKPLLLPDIFICDAPFGIETLQLVAQTVPFKPLILRNEDGYQFIENDLGTILANVRGMKTSGETTLIGEKRLVLTTYADK